MQGWKQRKELQEHQSIIASVVKGVIIILIIALASMLRWHIYRMDVNNAFCYANIAGDVYVSTIGEEVVEPRWCYKLQKSLYGLQSSPRSWNIHKTSLTFLSCVLDLRTCYRYNQGQLEFYSCVDDIIISTADMQGMV